MWTCWRSIRRGQGVGRDVVAVAVVRVSRHSRGDLPLQGVKFAEQNGIGQGTPGAGPATTTPIRRSGQTVRGSEPRADNSASGAPGRRRGPVRGRVGWLRSAGPSIRGSRARSAGAGRARRSHVTAGGRRSRRARSRLAGRGRRSRARRSTTIRRSDLVWCVGRGVRRARSKAGDQTLLIGHRERRVPVDACMQANELSPGDLVIESLRGKPSREALLTVDHPTLAGKNFVVPVHTS